MKLAFREGGIDCLAICLGGCRDIGPALQPPFHLERDHAGFNQRLDVVVSREVLWTEEISAIAKIAYRAIDNHLIWQSACLGTLPTVCTTTTKCLAGKALAAVGHAECTVNEYLHRHFGVGSDFADIFGRKLARQNNPCNAKLRHNTN